MIVYLHPSQQPCMPPWLDGFEPGAGVQVCGVATPAGYLVGVGDPLLFQAPPARVLHDVEDGWKAAIVGKLDPLRLIRRQKWCATQEVADLDGRSWLAPVILDAAGDRGFLVRYGGPDFLPMLTDEQARCLHVAQAARAAAQEGINMAAVCRWASILLSASIAVSPGTLAALGLIDDALAVGTLEAATRRPLVQADP